MNLAVFKFINGFRIVFKELFVWVDFSFLGLQLFVYFSYSIIIVRMMVNHFSDPRLLFLVYMANKTKTNHYQSNTKHLVFHKPNNCLVLDLPALLESMFFFYFLRSFFCLLYCPK